MAQDRAERAERIAEYKASGDKASRSIDVYLEKMRQTAAETRARTQQMRQQSDAQARQIAARSQQGVRQAEAFFERSRTRPVQPPRVQPIASGPRGPSFAIPSGFPEHRPAYVRQRTPLEAFREGQELGEAIGGMIRGFMDRDKRKRRDAIVKRYFSDTITREDYEQLVDDGYADLALELKQAERR